MIAARRALRSGEQSFGNSVNGRCFVALLLLLVDSSAPGGTTIGSCSRWVSRFHNDSNFSVYSTSSSTSRPIRTSAAQRGMSRGAVQASSGYSDIWMFGQLPRRSMDSARADRRLPASITRAAISLRRRGT